MNARRLTGPPMLAMLAAAMIALAGCGHDAGPSAQPSASASVDPRAALLDAARCLRAHGYPNWPDPVQGSNGRWEFPQSANLPARVNAPACEALLRKAKQGSRAANQVSAQDMAKLRQFAKCMREHGVSYFPDPDSDGNFGLTPQQESDPAQRTASRACKQYLPPQPPK